DNKFYIPIWWHPRKFFRENIWVLIYYWDFFQGLGFHAKTIGSDRLTRVWQVTRTPSGFVRCTTLSVQPMRPLCRLNQSIPRITSIPLDLSTTRSARNFTPLKLILTRRQPSRQCMLAPGV